MFVELEIVFTNGKEYKRKVGGEKYFGCCIKFLKYISESKGDCEYIRYLVYDIVFLLIVSVVSLIFV